MRRSLNRLFLATSICVSLTVGARAQCLDWKPGFEATGKEGPTTAFAVFDDGMGPALYAAAFPNIYSLDGAVSKWDGGHWNDLPVMRGAAYALSVFDDGSGPALYAGGTILAAGGVPASAIAKWNGKTWSALGPGLHLLPTPLGLPNDCCASVHALAVYDDGTGPALYAAGDFAYAGPTYVSGIAKWNGTNWSDVGGGVNGGEGFAAYSLAVFDDGSGPALFAGGDFTFAGGSSTNRIAKWNGTSWSTLGAGSSALVGALTVFDDGSGPALYASGSFSVGGGSPASNVARWNGSAWSAVGGGTDGYVAGLTVFDDGGGAALYAVGAFLNAGGVSAPYVAKWNGSSWSSLAFSSVPLPSSQVQGVVSTALGFDDGSGPALFVGGRFIIVDGVVMNYVAKWQGSIWSPVPAGVHGLSGIVRALASFDGGAGAALYAGGWVQLLVGNLARWTGSSWEDVPGLSSNAQVNCLTVADDGSGPALFVGGGNGLGIKRFNGSTWTALGTGTSNGTVNAIAPFDDGSGTAIFVGGNFLGAGGVSASRIAKWNGTSWAALGSGIGSSGNVLALAVFDDGSGSALYVGGQFTIAGGQSAKRIARWNGTSWSALGSGMDGSGSATNVAALAVFDDGTGAALYAAGLFATAGAVNVNHVARWNGSTWSAVGTGFDAQADALYVFDDGTGSQLYAGGSFANADGVSAPRVARWNGTSWTALDNSIGGDSESAVFAFAAFNDDAAGNPDLFLGGLFEIAGPPASDQIAQWLGCGPGVPYCFGDGLDPVVTAQCPCSNFGKTGHGCGNSLSPSGGLLIATGTTNPNTVVFTMSSVPNNALATGFSNATNTNPGGVVFGDGVRCQSGALVRFGSHDTGTLGDAPNTWSAPAFTIAPGLTRYYQVQYRNPAPAFCPPGTFNITNGYRIAW